MEKFNRWLAGFFALIGGVYLTLALLPLRNTSIFLVITAILFAGVALGVFKKQKWAWHVAYALLLIPLIFIPLLLVTKFFELRLWEIIVFPAFFLLCLVAFKSLRKNEIRKQYGVAESLEQDITEKKR